MLLDAGGSSFLTGDGAFGFAAHDITNAVAVNANEQNIRFMRRSGSRGFNLCRRGQFSHHPEHHHNAYNGAWISLGHADRPLFNTVIVRGATR